MGGALTMGLPFPARSSEMRSGDHQTRPTASRIVGHRRPVFAESYDENARLFAPDQALELPLVRARAPISRMADPLSGRQICNIAKQN